MKALRFYAPGDVRLEDVPEPVAGPDEVKIRVRNCSTCGTDVKIRANGHVNITRVTTMGHEIAGEVVEADKILFPAIRRCVEQQSLPSFHQDLPIVRAHFQGRHTMGGMALIKRALLEGDLLQRIMEM